MGTTGPVVLCGDFNLHPDAEPILLIKASLRDAFYASELPPHGSVATFHGFTYDDQPKERIDYVFVSDDLQVSRYGALTDSRDRSFFSDHLPVLVTLTNKLTVVRKELVKEKVMEERWFRYEGETVSEVLLVKRNLDYTTPEPLDSSYTGHIDYDYEGSHITGETEYRIQQGVGTLYPVREVSYEYDEDGNFLSRSTIYLDGSEADEIVTMGYDSGRHPFYGLNYYFTGESFVNNLLTRTVGSMDYSYDVRLDSRDYPETIYEKRGSSYSRIMRYTYMCCDKW